MIDRFTSRCLQVNQVDKGVKDLLEIAQEKTVSPTHSKASPDLTLSLSLSLCTACR